MPRLTKKLVEALECCAGHDVFVWDGELRGFGVRAKPCWTKAFLMQYRNQERRTRGCVIGKYGVRR